MRLQLTRADNSRETFLLHDSYDFQMFDQAINNAIEIGGEVRVLLAGDVIYPFQPRDYRTIALILDVDVPPSTNNGETV